MANPNPIIELRKALRNSAMYVKATWQLALSGDVSLPGVGKLTSNKSLLLKYASSIYIEKPIKIGNGSIDWGLSQDITAKEENIAKMLESGTPAFDMKPMLLKNAKTSGSGTRYKVIPFKYDSGSGSVKDSMLPKMPSDIFAQAKKLTSSIGKQGNVQWGGRLKGTEDAYPAGFNQVTRTPHTSGRFEGMVKIKATKGSKPQFMTFRVVTDGVKSQGKWWHKGYRAHNIMRSVAKYCEPEINRMVAVALHNDFMLSITVNV